MTKYMILNSDDFGISDGVSRGILEAHQDGILSSTCTMINMPSAPEAIRLAQTTTPDLGVGLHVTLSYGKPISSADDVPSLIGSDDSFVQTFEQLMEKLADFEDADLKREVEAQFNHFVTLAGRLPTHIDSHHRAAYLHPASFEAMCQLCQEHNLPMRRPLWLDDSMVYDPLTTNADGMLIDKLRAIYTKYEQPRCPDYLVGTFQWGEGSRLGLFQSHIEQVGEGYTEVICHVGYAEGLEEAYTLPREDELRAVLDPQLKRTLADNNIELITFNDLPK